MVISATPSLIKPTVRRAIAVLAIAASMFGAQIALAAKVTLDRTQISMSESATLTVEAEDDGALPDDILRNLERNFDVTSRGQSKQTSCVNFSCTSTSSTAYMLEPKAPGIYTIPGFTLDGEAVAARQLQVNAINTDPNKGPVSNIFAELSVDNKEVTLQQQVLLTVKVNTAVNLTDLNIEPLNIPNTLLKEIGQTSYQRTLGSKLFQTYEVRYALFPQASGTLQIPPLTVHVARPDGGRQGFRSLFSSNRQERVRTNSETVDVTTPPPHKGDWLPAQTMSLKDSWSSDLLDLKVGDSITRTITTTALGLSAEQLPPITMDGTANYKTYPDQPASEDRQNERGIVGIHTDSIAIVPTQSGTVTLPAIQLQWWNLTTQKLQTAELPAVTLTVKPNPDAAIAPQTPPYEPVLSNSQPTAEPPASTTAIQVDHQHLRLWQIATTISSVLALVFLVLWLSSRRRPTAISDEQLALSPEASQLPAALNALKSACQLGQPDAIRVKLLAWAKLRWPEASAYSTMDVARLLQSAQANEALKALDAALFQGEPGQPQHWQTIADACEKSQATANILSKDQLAPLYPNNG
ncbi:Uncharacterised protein [BD1-7 clade bacterium]|uniref:DUF7939 domain-containing protein n=1 Tax=BD1-7 clade bacterium TaxID=2029982 RepID=A0A5S9NMN9_9GAMM|nr:Uncharacterised protein [BD1-7 clade bacterium]CAA0094530.1 Uncharacterised protein [BD1-7 clade bacterium]